MMRSLGRCPTCQGAGSLDQRVQQTLSGRWETRTITCPQCHGDGEAWIRVDHGSDSRAPVAILTFALLVAIAVVVLIVIALAAPKPVAAAEPDQIGTAAGAMKGWATFFPACDRCAAASGDLQAAIGPDWQGSIVTVQRGGREVRVRLVTGCGCDPRHGVPTVIDLSPWAFAELLTAGERALGIDAKGVQTVRVEWGLEPDATLPPTDVDVHAVAVAVAETMPVWRLPVVAGLVAFVLAVVAYVVPSGKDDER